jgi:hypothetical protein
MHEVENRTGASGKSMLIVLWKPYRFHVVKINWDKKLGTRFFKYFMAVY